MSQAHEPDEYVALDPLIKYQMVLNKVLPSGLYWDR